MHVTNYEFLRIATFDYIIKLQELQKKNNNNSRDISTLRQIIPGFFEVSTTFVILSYPILRALNTIGHLVHLIPFVIHYVPHLMNVLMINNSFLKQLITILYVNFNKE